MHVVQLFNMAVSVNTNIAWDWGLQWKKYKAVARYNTDRLEKARMPVHAEQS